MQLFIFRPALARAVAAVSLVSSLGTAPAHATERSEIAAQYTWNLADLYASDSAWLAAKDSLAKRLPEVAALRGHLGDSSESLKKAIVLLADFRKDLSRLYSYASQKRDEDTRVSANAEKVQAMEQLGVEFSSASSFFAPELLALEPAKLKSLLAKAELKPYKFLLDDVLRRRAHTLSAGEEQVVAEAGNIADAGQNAYSMFTNADFPYAEVTLGDGKKVRLDASAYTKYRASKNRDDRLKVFHTFWGEYQKYTRTLGTTLYAQVKSHIFDKRVHRFGSSLEAALFYDNIPTAVYRQLITDVHKNLPTLHRYLALRQRMLGQTTLAYEDLYAPLVKGSDTTYTPEQGMDMTLRAVAPLGADYGAALRKAFDSRWSDFLPSTGKRSGAYSNGSAYDVHPYQLLNFMGQYEDVSTLAHESGHSMHSYLTNKTQP